MAADILLDRRRLSGRAGRADRVPQASGGLPASDGPTCGGTILFTAFVLLQFWNLFNAKCMGRTESVFPGLANNPSFLAVAAATLGGQVLLVQFGGEVFRTVPLGLGDWLALLGATSPVLWLGEAVRLARRLGLRRSIAGGTSR